MENTSINREESEFEFSERGQSLDILKYVEQLIKLHYCLIVFYKKYFVDRLQFLLFVLSLIVHLFAPSSSVYPIPVVLHPSEFLYIFPLLSNMHLNCEMWILVLQMQEAHLSSEANVHTQGT